MLLHLKIINIEKQEPVLDNLIKVLIILKYLYHKKILLMVNLINYKIL
jgi:hypothetical protein